MLGAHPTGEFSCAERLTAESEFLRIQLPLLEASQVIGSDQGVFGVADDSVKTACGVSATLDIDRVGARLGRGVRFLWRDCSEYQPGKPRASDSIPHHEPQ